MLSINEWYNRLSLTLKMFILTMAVGAFVWFLVDTIQTARIDRHFGRELDERLSQQAHVDRFLYDKYINLFKHTSRQITSLKNFNDYIDSLDWTEEGKRIEYRHTPPWFPKRSVLRSLAIPKFALLIDSDNHAREYYVNGQGEPPEPLLSPSDYLIMISEYQSYMMMIDDDPFIVTTERVYADDGTHKATLMLASPIDDMFLASTQQSVISTGIVALLSMSEPVKVIASSKPELIPAGTRLSELEKEYRITGQEFFDYGGSDLRTKLLSLISTKDVAAMRKKLHQGIRLDILISSVIFILSFCLVIYLITRQIKSLSKHVIEYERQELKLTESVSRMSGDELFVLRSSFNNLIKEIGLSREDLKSESDELARINKELRHEIDEKIKVEAALRVSEEETRLLYETAPNGICELDLDGYITNLNPAYEKITGYDRDSLIGRPTWELMVPGEQKELLPEYIKYLVREEPAPSPYEAKYVRKDGRIIYTRIDWAYKRDKEGGIKGLVCILSDITEQKNAEEARRKDFLNLVGTMVIAIATDGTVSFINEAGANILGYKREDIVGRNWLDNYHAPGERKRLLPQLKGVMSGKRAITKKSEGLIINRDGEERMFQWNSVLLRGDSNEVIGVLSTGLDVTDERAGAEALRVSETNLVDAQRIARLGSWNWDIASGKIRCSRELHNILGLNPNRFVFGYEDFLNTVHPDDMAYVHRTLEDAIYVNKPYNIDYRIVLPNNEERVVFSKGVVTCDPDGKPLTLAGTVQDVTESKRVEQALVESEHALAEAQMMAKLGSWRWNIVTGEIFWSDEMYCLYGYEPNEIIPQYESILERIHPEDIERITKQFADIFREKVAVAQPFKYRIILKNGDVRALYGKSIIKYDEDGKPVSMRSIIQDITEGRGKRGA